MNQRKDKIKPPSQAHRPHLSPSNSSLQLSEPNKEVLLLNTGKKQNSLLDYEVLKSESQQSKIIFYQQEKSKDVLVKQAEPLHIRQHSAGFQKRFEVLLEQSESNRTLFNKEEKEELPEQQSPHFRRHSEQPTASTTSTSNSKSFNFKFSNLLSLKSNTANPLEVLNSEKKSFYTPTPSSQSTEIQKKSAPELQAVSDGPKMEEKPLKTKTTFFTQYRPFSDIHLTDAFQSPTSSTSSLMTSPITAQQKANQTPSTLRQELISTLITSTDGSIRTLSTEEDSQSQTEPIEAEETKGETLKKLLRSSSSKSKARYKLSSAHSEKNLLSLLNPVKVFDFLLVVSLFYEKLSDSQYKIYPKITYRFPPTLQNSDSLSDEELKLNQLMDNIPLFCFPECCNTKGEPIWTLEDFMKHDFPASSETFSFVLTDLDHSKRFGYCKRILSDLEISETIQGVLYKKKMPEVYCMVSASGSFSLFSQILEIVEKKRGVGNKSAILQFLNAVISQPFPKPGRTLVVQCHSLTDEPLEEYQFYRPMDMISFEHVSFKTLLNCLGIMSLSTLQLNTLNAPYLNLVTLLTALLMERRIVFISNSLQRLTDCCNAALALIYPMEWQHIFIPILPKKLLDFLCSPTPFLIGLLAADRQMVENRNSDLMTEELIIFDLDSQQVTRNDFKEEDANRIPVYLLNRLKIYLLEAYKTENARDLKIHESFLYFFLLLFGCYRSFMEIDLEQQPQELLVYFDHEAFIQQHPLCQPHPSPIWSIDFMKQSQKQIPLLPSPSQKSSIRIFLQTLLESQNFQYFMQQREEAFQYHYQIQLNKGTGEQKLNGLKNYYAVAQSRFEKKVTQIEVENGGNNSNKKL